MRAIFVKENRKHLLTLIPSSYSDNNLVSTDVR